MSLLQIAYDFTGDDEPRVTMSLEWAWGDSPTSPARNLIVPPRKVVSIMQMHHAPAAFPVTVSGVLHARERSRINPLIAGHLGEEPLTTNAGMPTLKA